MSFNSILGKVSLGAFEPGQIASSTDARATFTAGAPTLAITIDGGTPLRRLTSILGVIKLGSFELGEINGFDSGNILGRFTFIATAEALASFIGATSNVLNFEVTAQPLLFVGVGISFVASADPRMSLQMEIPPSFTATASPQMKVFVLNSQQQSCLVPGPLARSSKPVNYVY